MTIQRGPLTQSTPPPSYSRAWEDTREDSMAAGAGEALSILTGGPGGPYKEKEESGDYQGPSVLRARGPRADRVGSYVQQDRHHQCDHEDQGGRWGLGDR